MPRHKLVEVPDGSDDLTAFPNLKTFCADFHAASNACIEKSYTGEIDRDACEPLFQAFKECKKRMNAFKNKYDQGLLKLEDVPRKDSGVPPAIP